jgi:excisionase family DNA binding protein
MISTALQILMTSAAQPCAPEHPPVLADFEHDRLSTTATTAAAPRNRRPREVRSRRASAPSSKSGSDDDSNDDSPEPPPDGPPNEPTDEPQHLPLLLRIEQAMFELAVSRRTIYKLIKAKDLELVRIGPRCSRLRTEDVLRLAKARSKPLRIANLRNQNTPSSNEAEHHHD